MKSTQDVAKVKTDLKEMLDKRDQLTSQLINLGENLKVNVMRILNNEKLISPILSQLTIIDRDHLTIYGENEGINNPENLELTFTEIKSIKAKINTNQLLTVKINNEDKSVVIDLDQVYNLANKLQLILE